MKRYNIYLAMLLIAVTSFTLTSCYDDDDDWYWDDPYGWYDNYRGWGWNNNYDKEWDSNDNTLLQMAQTLCGEWYGTMTYSYISDDGQSRKTDNFYADMEFYQYNNASRSLSGNGVEIDYAKPDRSGESQTLKFTWYIDESTGNIYIKYTNSGATFVLDYGSTERGFHLGYENGSSVDTFYGYMIGTGNVNGDIIYIDLERQNTNSYAKPEIDTRSIKSGLSFGKGFTQQPLQSGDIQLNNRR